MNIRPKSPQELDTMRAGGQRLSAILERTHDFLQPGQSLKEIDAFIKQEIEREGGKPSFLGYKGYPASSCLSVNDVVVHGIPSDETLKTGDFVSVDIGFLYEGYHTDAAFTCCLGTLTEDQTNLITITQGALKEGIQAAMAGNNISDLGETIEKFVNSGGKFGIVRDLTGHGIGQNLQEPPEVPNYKTLNRTELLNSMTIAIEPMITLGDWRVTVDDDDWTIRTRDHSLAAHFETTVAVHDNDPIVLVDFPLSQRFLGPK